jgi:hypothetical protein
VRGQAQQVLWMCMTPTAVALCAPIALHSACARISDYCRGCLPSCAVLASSSFVQRSVRSSYAVRSAALLCVGDHSYGEFPETRAVLPAEEDAQQELRGTEGSAVFTMLRLRKLREPNTEEVELLSSLTRGRT